MNGINPKLIINGLAIFACLLALPFEVSAKTETLAFMEVFKPLSSTVQLAGGPDSPISQKYTSPIDSAVTREEHIKRIDAFFEDHDMPLAGYGAEFVDEADKCGIDWRLLPAISVRESSGGKHDRYNNPFGWASAKIKFGDYSEAIDVVTAHLCGLNPATARYYKDKSTFQILWAYNGTVLNSYPLEVMNIMDMI